MKKNKDLLAVLIFAVSMVLIGGCSRGDHQLWIQYQVAKHDRTGRSPAQSAPRCFIDRFQDSVIQQEVTQMETAYADGKHASYQHGDLQFSDLPQATIDVLKSNYLLDTTVSGTKSWTAVDPKQKDCKDYSCFINALYSNPTDEGLFQYWYFLKTGYPIAALKAFTWHSGSKTTTESPAGYPLEKYLFNRDEWKALWLTASMLPKSMISMPSLNEIHRLPHGFIPDPWKMSGTCGWAVGTWASGEILLSDECLGLNRNDPFDIQAPFYQSTTHEIAHRLSAWNFAGKSGPARPMDQDPEFLAISDWKMENLVQPGGAYRAVWKNNGQTIGWASEYAKTSPAEDFAETIGTFRTHPATLHARAPAKYEYAKKKVFAGRGYTEDDLKNEYADDLKNAVIENIDQWLTPCVSGKVGTEATPKPSALTQLINVQVPVDEKVKACIREQVVATISTKAEQIRYDEPEGCAILDRFEDEITPAAITKLTPELNGYLKSSDRLTDLIGGVGEFRNAILKEFDGRALVLSCWQEKDPEACYQTKLDAEFDRLEEKYKVLLSVSDADLKSAEKKRFESANSYDRVYGDVVTFYDGFFAKFNDDIKTRTDQLWQTCLAVPSRVNTDVLLEPYTAGDQYVAPSIIQCVNERLPDEMTALRSEAGVEQGAAILSPDARNWVNERILFPRFKVLLDGKVSEVAKTEGLQLESAKAGSVDFAYQQLIQNTSWRKGQIYSYQECKAAVNPILQDRLKADSYRFVAVDPVVDQLGDQACEKVRAWSVSNASSVSKPNVPAVPAVSSTPDLPPVPTDAQKKELDPIWKTLQPLMVAEAQTRFDHCRSRVYFAQRLKRFCLFSEWVVDDQDHYRKNAWGWTTDRGIRKWMATPEVKAFMTSKTYSDDQMLAIARARAGDESQDFVDAILKAFYGN